MKAYDTFQTYFFAHVEWFEHFRVNALHVFWNDDGKVFDGEGKKVDGVYGQSDDVVDEPRP